ncbi:MAG: 16S rRNA (cytidine(1402)-2'-O)-methyltransferase [Elusimicrobiota bacterium]
MEKNTHNGKLYLVATPIGNIQDLSFRALETLKNSDVVLVEDTRRSKILFNTYGIHSPMISYHPGNSRARENFIVNKLLEGKMVSVISDSGTPGISDPGESLVRKALINDIRVECVPGPAAFVCALAGSGLPANGFVFLGFLQRKKSRIKKMLTKAALLERTIIFYESPYRIEKTLATILEVFPENTRCVIARELTKKFEEFLRGTIREVFEEVRKRKTSLPEKIRGEIVVLISPLK